MSVIIQLTKIEEMLTKQIETYQDERSAVSSVRMTDAEYKQNWADWEKAVEIRYIITSAISDVQKALKEKPR
jgi:hypothetical protein